MKRVGLKTNNFFMRKILMPFIYGIGIIFLCIIFLFAIFFPMDKRLDTLENENIYQRQSIESLLKKDINAYIDSFLMVKYPEFYDGTSTELDTFYDTR